jgi:hypothetical protein
MPLIFGETFSAGDLPDVCSESRGADVFDSAETGSAPGRESKPDGLDVRLHALEKIAVARQAKGKMSAEQQVERKAPLVCERAASWENQ